MFGVLVQGVYHNDNGTDDYYNFFKIFKTLDEAKGYAENSVNNMKLHATIYDYDMEYDSYEKFFDVG